MIVLALIVTVVIAMVFKVPFLLALTLIGIGFFIGRSAK